MYRVTTQKSHSHNSGAININVSQKSGNMAAFIYGQGSKKKRKIMKRGK